MRLTRSMCPTGCITSVPAASRASRSRRPSWPAPPAGGKLPMARRLEWPDGSFAGVVRALIGTEHLYEVISSMKVGDHGSIALFDAEHNVLVRSPQVKAADGSSGLKVGSPQLLALLGQNLASATYEAHSAVDGQWRTFAYRRIGDYPLYVVVGLSPQDYLDPWFNEALVDGLFLAAICVGGWVSLVLLRRAWRRQEGAIEELTPLPGRTGGDGRPPHPGAGRCEAGRRVGRAGQVGVPREYESRDPHPDERRARDDRVAAGLGAG